MHVLLDGGPNANMVLPESATIVKAPTIELQEQMMLQLTVTSSCSKINYGTWVPAEFRPINAKVYFDIANIKGYNTIMGTHSSGSMGYPQYDQTVWGPEGGH